MHKPQGRKKPYTEEEIVKKKCCRCGKPAWAQWQICADSNLYRPVCKQCDIEINRWVFWFMRIPDRFDKLNTYIAKVCGEDGDNESGKPTV